MKILRTQRVRKLLIGVLVGALVGLLSAAGAALRPPALERAELVTYDARARAAARPEQAGRDIIIIDVGESDIRDVEDHLGLTWPWPRALFAYLTQYLSQAGAKAIVLDWIFQDRGAYGATDADELARALHQSQRAVFGLVLSQREPAHSTDDGRWALALASFATADAARAAAQRLRAWNVRCFFVGSAPTTVLYGGKTTAAEALATWRRLSTQAELADLFQSATPPTPHELDQQALASELTTEALITARDSFPPAPADIAIPHQRSLEPPLAVLAASPARLGTVLQENEADGLLRRHAPLVEYRGRLYPSLPLAAYLIAHPEQRPRFDSGALLLGHRRIPLDEQGRFSIRFHGAGTSYPHVAAYDVLQSQALLDEGRPYVPTAAPERFRDKYVIISASAYALRDLRVTPVARIHLGAEVGANALDNLEQGRVIRRLAARHDALITFGLILTLTLLVVVAWEAAPHAAFALLAGSGLTAATLGGYWLLARHVYQAHDLWIAVAVPTLGTTLAAFGVLLGISVLERGDRRFVQEALGRYTSPVLVRQLVAQPRYLSLDWCEQRDVTVYFSDIAGFTAISEQLAPERLVALLNDYLTHMTELVLSHGGVVDKYIGDAIMAFWGAPLPTRDHARQAVLCALAMRRRCTELREVWQREYGHIIVARAGLNSGPCIAGNVGSKHKYNYTVMGDMVNLASRLEGANKTYGTTLMVSELTAAHVRDLVVLRELDYLTVKGRSQPVRVYEVLDTIEQLDPQLRRLIAPYEEGLACYRAQQFDAARGAFEQALAIAPRDAPSLLYLERCEHFLREPPPQHWDGVWHLKEK